MGVGHITEYEIRHRLGSSLLGINRVDGGSTSHRVGGLRPGTGYRFEIRAFIDSLEGPAEVITATTSAVGEI